MGWFLNKHKSAARKPARKRRHRKLGPTWDPKRTLAGLKVLGIIAALVAAAVGWRITESALVRYAKDTRATPLTSYDVTLQNAPDLWDDATRKRLQQTVAACLTSDPFDDAGLQRAAQALANDPWVADVTQVRRTPTGILVEASYRSPFAAVMARDGFHVIATDGTRLAGPMRLTSVSPSNLPLLRGVTSAPPALGERWRDRELQAGIELVHLLAPQPYAGQIVAYDVGRRDEHTGTPALVLITDEGEVVWGRSPSDEWAVTETSVDEKLQRLQWLAHNYRDLDGGGRRIRIHGAGIEFDHRPDFQTQTTGG